MGGEIRRKFLASLQVLRELKALEKPIIVALNKIDLIEEADAEEKVRLIWELSRERGISLEDVVKISAREGRLEELMDALNRVVLKLPPKYGAFRIIVKEPEKVPAVMALINSVGEVLSVEYGEKTMINAYVQTGMVGEIKKMGGAEIERLNHSGEGEELEQDEGYPDGG